MKKYLLSAIAAMGLLSSNAQERLQTDDGTLGMSDLFSHPRINIYEGVEMPNTVGTQHYDSISRNRIWRAEQPRLYAYVPGLEERTSKAVIVIPGGGYIKQAYETAGVSIAKWLNTFGVTAFVLLHRLPNQPDVKDATIVPFQDAQRAVRWVRAHAAEYGIDREQIGVIGCSAGGHVCAGVSTIGQDLSACGDSLDRQPFRPNFCILVSPVICDYSHEGQHPRIAEMLENTKFDEMVTNDNPPTLLIHASDDRTVNVSNSVKYFTALQNAGVKNCSLHIFPFGGHSISLRNQPGSTALWPAIAEEWMNEVME
jgi:acetyl esterase/lipase